jgi:hypothetical protein
LRARRNTRVSNRSGVSTADGEPPRWRYRYRNFKDALTLLREAAGREPGSLNDLEREGMIQRFKYTFETVAANIDGRHLHLFETLWMWLREEEAES